MTARGCVALLALVVLSGCSSGAQHTDRTGSPCRVGFVQPFSLMYSYADSHVIAFLSGDKEFEAIEAMIAERADAAPLVRVILTRHDKTQIDYLSDHTEVRRQAILTNRETHETPIDVGHRVLPGGGDVFVIRFSLQDGRPVELRATGTAAPNAAFGGLTDPRGHAATSAVPAMWRDASALVSSASVSIDHMPVGVGHASVGLDAYITHGFRLGVLAASRQSLRVGACPDRVVVGSEWRLDTDTGPRTYRVTNIDRDAVTITDGSDIVTGRTVHDRIEIERIRVASPRGSAGVTLSLSTADRFSLSIDGRANLVTGTFTHNGDARHEAWLLSPRQPAWATGRTARVEATTTGDDIRTSVAIGDR